MKCNSCRVEIDPRLKFAIARNSCPACGRKIFSEIEFFFRKSLLEILEKNNVNYPEQVNAIVDDIVGLIDKQARSARENGELPTASPDEVEVDEVDAAPIRRREAEQDEVEDDSPAARATQEEIDFMNENGVVLGDGSLDDAGSDAMEEIRKKAARLKKKVKKTSGPRPITLRES